MKRMALLVLLFAFLVVMGGLIGFIRAHSIASLVMGGSSGILLALCAFGILKHNEFAYKAAIALTALLTVIFTYRYFLKFALIPAGLMALISFLMTLRLAFRHKFG